MQRKVQIKCKKTETKSYTNMNQFVFWKGWVKCTESYLIHIGYETENYKIYNLIVYILKAIINQTSITIKNTIKL